MKKITILAVFLLSFAAAPARADSYKFDKAHTTILFTINHMGFSEMVGIFRDYDGSFVFNQTHPEKSSVEVTIRPSGLETSSSALDKELQKSSWFNTENFPEMKFASTAVKVTGKNTADITGDLTLLGVTKPVTLHVHFNKADYQQITNNYVAGFYAEGVLKRSDFGMDYAISMIGDKIHLQIWAEGINQEKKQPAIIRNH